MIITVNLKNVLFCLLLLVVVAIVLALAISMVDVPSGNAFYPTITPIPLKPIPTPNIPDPSDYCYYPEIPNYDIIWCQMVYAPMVKK